MKPRICSLVLAMLMAPLAHADAVSYIGSLAPDDPNDVFITSFTILAPTAVTIQTWSFGGGKNAAGVVVPAGGFDPYVSLFSGTGSSATFIGSNDDGLCPPGHAASACADSTLTSGLLPAGSYTLALSLPFNFSFAENYGSGTLGDGFIGLDSSFDDGSCAARCTSAYAVDISYTAAVPEPASWWLLGIGLTLLAIRRRRGARPVGACDFFFVTSQGHRMNSKTLRPLVAAAAALFNVAFMTASYAQAKAALTRDVDRATAQPATGACSAFSNGIGTLKCALYTVPAGKRLVVETVSYRMTTASGTPIYFVNFGEDVGFADLPFGTPNIFNVAPVFAYASGGDTTYTGTQALRMYVDENKVFAAGGSRGGSVNYEQRFSFSGYLVDK